MSDDDDYMSDKFINEIKKQEELKIDKQPKRKKLCVRENDSPKNTMLKNREEGLSTSIPSSNKGYELLKKMGYKHGQGIGKTETGIAEPIPIDFKNDKKGLGTEKKKTSTELIKHFQKTLADRMSGTKVEDFRSRLAQEKIKKFNDCDLYKSQKLCQRFDEQNEIKEPEEKWFWPEEDKEVEEDDQKEIDDESEEKLENDEEIELSVECKLAVLTEYLRLKYFYCIWCAVKYNDSDDLESNCPGNSRNEH